MIFKNNVSLDKGNWLFQKYNLLFKMFLIQWLIFTLRMKKNQPELT